MTRLDSARETASKTRDTAAHLADGAKARLGPALDALGPKAAQAAQGLRVQYERHVAPQFGHAFASLPPEAQQNVLKAFHRAQEAALAARLSAARAAGQARTTVGPRVVQVVEETRAVVVPVAQEAQTRGAAALTALQGHVTSAEISELAARNVRKEQHNGWATGLAVAGAVAIGSGVLAWQWWRRHSNPEWLVEPPSDRAQPPGAHAAGSAAPVNGSAPTGTPTNNPEDNPPDPSADPSANPTSGSGDSPSGSAGPGAGTATPKPGPPPGKPAEDDRPKPHDPRKPH
ncbi:DUF5324 family protein [Kitasatospora sp. NPDC097643]|uniref:DUF5324 family protein n=1 Tax=Kitasatospora sp. NPDC097643 TaxID=3157230 RepID=UPI0033334473